MRGCHQEPGGASRSQEQPGRARMSQEVPGGARRSQEEPGGARRSLFPQRIFSSAYTTSRRLKLGTLTNPNGRKQIAPLADSEQEACRLTYQRGLKKQAG